jgi:predicted ATP-binding protein involved in virulence
MLFRLIFETPTNAIVLIDEPEISLHVLWQLEFMADLQDIQKANRFQSIIATHSPQIFQGMEDRVVDLADQVQ